MEKEKTEDIGFMEIAKLCANTLFEKYFSGDCGDSVLFMAFTDGKSWDATVAGNAVNTVQLLTECCIDNPDVLKVMLSTITNTVDIDGLIDALKGLKKHLNKQ